MIDILNILKKDPDKVDIRVLKDKIEEYYSIHDRHSYSEISKFIYNKCEEGDFEYISENLSKVIQGMEDEKSKYLKQTEKLIDHIELENIREFHIKDTYRYEIQKQMREQRVRQSVQIRKQKNELLEEIEDAKKSLRNEFEEQKREIDNLNGNLVSVLGIFGAIIVAFFGGLSFLGGVLDNMHNVSAYRLTFIGTLYLVGLFNIIFLLFYCISKIVHKPLWTNSANKSKCSECTKVNRCRCFIKKYPLVSYFNIALIFLLLNIVFLYTVDKFNISAQIIEWFNGNSTKGLNIILGIMLIYSSVSLLVGIVIWILSSMKVIKNCFKCPCNITQNSGQEQCNCNNNVNEAVQEAAGIL